MVNLHNESLFTKIEKLGSGGFGDVYKAKDVFEDEIAIKILKEAKINEIGLQRFEREIKIHTQLHHKNIVPIINFNLDKRELYYTMPLAKYNFTTFLSKFRQDNLNPMDDNTAAFYFEQILDGIEYAHKEGGVIHRDLKPENILVFEGDVLKISDFGLGKYIYRDATTLTQTRTSLGNDIYAAPEQWEQGDAKNVDERADIYSLGKILYEILTYNLPFSIDMEAISNSKFRHLIKKATQVNRDNRYSSIDDLRKYFDLLRDKKSSEFTNPSQQFYKHLRNFYKSGRKNELTKLLQLLISQHDNFLLYTQNFMELDRTILNKLYLELPEEFCEVVENYLGHTNGRHAFNFTDIITNFLLDIYSVCFENETLFEKIFEQMLILAYKHNRFYIGQTFAEHVSRLTDINYILIIIDILERHKTKTCWVKGYLLNYQLPKVIEDCL